MSANTSITEGGKGYPFGPVKCLMVEGDNGEFYPWYPGDDRALDSLSVTQNGIYRASDRGVYGWSRVSVNVPQTDSVTGRDPQTGQEVTVTADPETGELVETVVPVEIRVITPPSKTEYQDGETIDISGMVVKAYDANGDEMQVVPIGEITINPTTAIFDESKDRGTQGKASYDAVTGLQQPILYCTKLTRETQQGGGAVDIYTENAGAIAGYRSGGNYTRIMASASQPASTWKTEWYNEDGEKYYENSGSDNGTPFTYENKTVYWSYTTGGMGALAPQNAVRSGGSPGEMDAWVMIYGNREETSGSPQTITVSWPRPGDGAILETSFDINVTGGE